MAFAFAVQQSMGPWNGINTDAAPVGAAQPDEADKPIAPYVMPFMLHVPEDETPTYVLPSDSTRDPEYLGTQVGDVLMTWSGIQDVHPEAKLRGVTCLNGLNLSKCAASMQIAGYPIFKELAEHESGSNTIFNYTKAGRMPFLNRTNEIWPDNTRLVWDFPDPATTPRFGVRITMYLRPLEGAIDDWFSLEKLAKPDDINNLRARMAVKTLKLHRLAKKVHDGAATVDEIKRYEKIRTMLLLRFVAEGTIETAEVIAPGKFGRCIICRGA